MPGDFGLPELTGRPPLPDALPAAVTDSHCHLDIQYDDESVLSPQAALDLANRTNVTRIVQVGCSLPDARWAVEVARTVPGIVAAIGIHPNEAPRLAGGLENALTEIELLAGDPAVRGIGETGLDFFRTGPQGRGVQEESFRRHIDIARRLRRALVIHDRDAHREVLTVLRAEAAGGGLPEVVVFHCFSGDAQMARDAADQGWYVSFSGVVTFRNAHELHEAVKVVPRDLLLVETDAPYLTPVPHRGRPNASYLIPHTMRRLAQLRGDDLGELCWATQGNTVRAFGAW